MLSAVSNVEVKNFTVNNMYVRTSSTDTTGGGDGIIVAGGTNISVHNNTIAQGDMGIMMIYPTNTSMTHIKIYSNTISGNNWGIGLGEQDTNSIADDIQIYSNDITGSGAEWDSPGDAPHHNGIHTFAVATGDSITNLKIFNNYIRRRLRRGCYRYDFY